jgi:hypothetical protein
LAAAAIRALAARARARRAFSWRSCEKTVSRSGETFIDDLPASAFLHPILSLLEDVGEVVAAVILLEGHDNHVFLARVAKNAELAQIDLDPGLSCCNQPFLLRPLAMSPSLLRKERE